MGVGLPAPLPPLHFFQEVSNFLKALSAPRCFVTKHLICGVNLRCLFGSLSFGCKMIQLEPLYTGLIDIFSIKRAH